MATAPHRRTARRYDPAGQGHVFTSCEQLDTDTLEEFAADLSGIEVDLCIDQLS